MDKESVCVCVCIHTHTHTHTHTMEYYSDIKKNKILPFVTIWMNLWVIMLSEISQKEKDKYHMISLICGTKTKNKCTNKTKQKQT